MLIRHQHPVPPLEAIHLAEKSQRLAGQVNLFPIPGLVVRRQRGVHFPPRINRCVRDADFFDLFEVKEPLAVEQGVEGHHAEGRVEDGEVQGHDLRPACEMTPRAKLRSSHLQLHPRIVRGFDDAFRHWGE